MLRIEENDYNSEAFGMRMADVAGVDDGTPREEVRAALDRARGRGVEHLSAKVPVGMKRVLNALLAEGFGLVDTQLEYACRLGGELPRPRPCDGVTVAPYAERDVRAMARIAESSFSIDRWHSDPSLPDDLCDGYYSRWVESCAGGYAQEILVARADGDVVGFLTLRDDGGCGRIDLTAVARAHRGRGIYRSLVREAQGWAKDRRFPVMLATTQVDNLGSRVTWSRAGFVPSRGWYVLHRALG